MTIDQSGLFDQGTNVTHARTVRALASAFVRNGGLVSNGDLQVTGDPSTLAVNVDTGCGLVQYGAPNQFYEPFQVDTAEHRTLLTATGNRVDLIFAGVQSEEFGDSVNKKDLYVVRGVDGSTDVPDVADPGGPGPMAGALPLASIAVPSGATRGSQCTIKMLAQTVAPVRDGGFTSDDLAPTPPTQWVTFLQNFSTGAGGFGGYAHGAPFTPKAAVMIPQYPNSSADGGWSNFAPGVFHFTHADANDVYGAWFDLDGTAAPEDANFSAYLVSFAGN